MQHIISRSSVPKKEYMHRFIHTLYTMPKNSYLEIEMCREAMNWDQLIQRFEVKFTFEHESPLTDVSLKDIRTNIFLEEGPIVVVPMCSVHIASTIVHKLLECYNVVKEEQDEEDTRDIPLPKTKGENAIEEPYIEKVVYAQPLKMWKVNIGTKENPKFAQIGDFLNDETVEKFAYLLFHY
jgi:hypothetical protein